jgi:hypothetical protein
MGPHFLMKKYNLSFVEVTSISNSSFTINKFKEEISFGNYTVKVKELDQRDNGV